MKRQIITAKSYFHQKAFKNRELSTALPHITFSIFTHLEIMESNPQFENIVPQYVTDCIIPIQDVNQVNNWACN